MLYPHCVSIGITGNIETNDTYVHYELKMAYHERDARFMLKMLDEHPNKMPAPTCDDVIRMLVEAERTSYRMRFMDQKITLYEINSEMVGPQMVAFREKKTAAFCTT